MSEAASPLRLKDCGFCRILADRAEAPFLFWDERVAAFMDIAPVTPGHLLVVPIRHAVYLSELNPEAGVRMFEVAQSLAAALRMQNGDSPTEGTGARSGYVGLAARLSPSHGSDSSHFAGGLKCEGGQPVSR